MWTSSEFLDRVEAAVAAAEDKSDAEVVVVIAPRSGHYRDLAALFGVMVSVAILAFVLFSPLDFDPLVIPAVVIGVGAIAGAVYELGDFGFLATEGRLRAQVRSAASAAFHEEVVHGTMRRTGVLVYLSLLEQRVEVLPDLGLQAHVPDAHWNALSFGEGHGLTTPEAFVAGLEQAAVLLAEKVPALADNPNEIVDRPRVRS